MPIEKIKSLIEIEPWLDRSPLSWLVLDIDETLVTTREFPGCEKWYEERVSIHSALGKVAAIQKANEEWEQLHLKTPVVCVENSIPEWVASFRQRPSPMIAATARAPRFAERTRSQLKEAGIEILPFGQNLQLSDTVYEGGILFVGPLGDKGRALRELFLTLGTPLSVIMVDDKRHHLESAETHLGQAGIGFQGAHIQSSHWLN
jgi:hypothetical protein